MPCPKEHCGVCGAARPPNTNCRPCSNRRNREYKKRHAERVRAKRADYKARNKEKIAAYRAATRDEKSAKDKSYYLENADRIKARVSTYRKMDVARNSRLELAWSRKNPEKRAKIRSAWKRRNAGKVNASTAARFATKLHATPQWADHAAIMLIYMKARQLRLETGIDRHVDHVVPLRHHLVCGLHCEDNLQVLPSKQNLSKNNRYWPDMPE
jgi:predicted nucleic acid-binding Zn ribbon protein